MAELVGDPASSSRRVELELKRLERAVRRAAVHEALPVVAVVVSDPTVVVECVREAQPDVDAFVRRDVVGRFGDKVELMVRVVPPPGGRASTTTSRSSTSTAAATTLHDQDDADVRSDRGPLDARAESIGATLRELGLVVKQQTAVNVHRVVAVVKVEVQFAPMSMPHEFMAPLMGEFRTLQLTPRVLPASPEEEEARNPPPGPAPVVREFVPWEMPPPS